MTPYITVVTVQSPNGNDLILPIPGVHKDAAAARANAILVLAALEPIFPEDMKTLPTTIVPIEQSEDAVREYLASLRQHRPDLLKTKRGKP